MISLIVETVGGLSLFIFGMTMMSDGLKMSAGKKIKLILSVVSSNRIIGCFTGAMITAIIQSSSATTVILIGFVNAGLMSLQQAIGMILGANVGTTMTAQLIAFKLSNIALPAIIIGISMKFLSKKKKMQHLADTILGFGLIFFGMTIMKNALSPMKSNPSFIEFFTTFSPDTLIGLISSVLAGAIITVLIQSSSATIGLTMALASQGLISFPGAMALVLGENIGTTITAELATIGSQNINAIRTARAHTIFNVLGVGLILSIFPIFIKIVESITLFLGAEPIGTINNISNTNNISRYIANGHTMFNLLNTIFFLFTLKWLVKMTKFLSFRRNKDDNLYTLQNCNTNIISMPMALIAEIECEVLRMAELAKFTFLATIEQIEKRNCKILFKWKEAEINLDQTQKVIMSYLIKLYQNDLTTVESREVSSLMRMTNNIERIGDCIESIAHATEIMIDEEIVLSKSALKDFHILSKTVLSFINLIMYGIKYGNYENFVIKANILEDTIDNTREEMREKHITKIRSKSCNLNQGLVYINILTNLEKIGDYCFNISYAVADRK